MWFEIYLCTTDFLDLKQAHLRQVDVIVMQPINFFILI